MVFFNDDYFLTKKILMIFPSNIRLFYTKTIIYRLLTY